MNPTQLHRFIYETISVDSAPLAGYLHGRKPFVELITPLIQHRQAATSIMVYAEVIEYLQGLPDFTHRKKQLVVLLREVYPYFLTYAILERYADIRHYASSECGA